MNISCGNCGIEFCLPDAMYHARKLDGQSFYCPNGHVVAYSPSANEKRIAELEGQIRNRDRRLERLRGEWEELYAQREDLISALKECPGGCGWRSRKQVPRDAVAMGRGLERVRVDVAEHLMTAHGARSEPTRALVERT